MDLTTYKVVGILTWGLPATNPLHAIWIKKPVETRAGVMAGAGLATIRFSPTSFEHLQTQRAVMNQMKKNIRLLGLLDTLVPTKEGLFVNKNVRVMGGEFTVNDLLLESPDHPVVVELVRLDRLLSSKGTGNITISNQDMLKMYIESYQKCLSSISSLRKGIENSQSATFFMKCNLKKSRMLEISRAYEALTTRYLQWCATQRGTGGQALQLNLYKLPTLESGLKGLGIKEE